MSEDVVKRAIRDLKDAKDHCVATWKRAEANHDFLSPLGDQWSKDDRREADELRVPALTINDALVAVDSIAGTETTGRFMPKIFGRDPGDEGWANAVNDWLRVERDACGLEVEESDAFRDLIVGGMAAVSLATELSDGHIPRTVARTLPVWETMWDRYARRPNLSDRRWHATGRWVDAEEAKRRFDGDAGVLKDLKDVDGAPASHWDADATEESTPMGSPWAYSGPGVPYDTRRGRVFLTEYEYRESDTSFLVDTLDARQADLMAAVLGRPAQPREELSERQFKELETLYEEELNAPVEEFIEIPRDSYRYVILAGDKELRKGKRPENYWTTLFMTGPSHKNQKEVRHYGLVDKMKDRQRFANAYYSAYIQVIARMAKLALLVEKGAIEDVAEFERKAARPGAILEVDILGKIEPLRHDAQGLSALRDAWSWCREEITAPAGISRYDLGRGGDLRRVSGSVLSQVRESSSTVLAAFFDGLKQFRTEEAKLLIRKLHAYWEPEDLARVVDPKNAAAIPPKEQWLDALKWDIKIDETPTSPTAKMELWNSLQSTGAWEMLIQGPYAMPPDLFTSIFPYITGIDRERWLAHIQQQQEMMAAQAAQQAPPQQ